MKAIELINAQEYDRAMSLLRQSDVECDKMLLLKPDKIRMALEKCNRNNPDAILIRSYMFGNDLEGAISYLKQGLKHHPNDPHLLRCLACMLGFAQRQKEGLPLMTRACELNPNEPRWLYHLAGCLRYFAVSFDKKGFDDRAIETYKRYLDLVPIDDGLRARACFSLAQLYWLKSSKKNSNTKAENMAEVKFYWDKGVEADENRLSCFEEVEASYHPMKTIEFVLKRECYLCASCRKQKPKFKCACLAEAYCDRTCQMASWKIHKLTCQAKKA
jgi:tetratricopeptide (TPR) repeat protein